jgi:acyl-CoA thioester hydrolase
LLQLCLQQHYAPRVPEPFRHRLRVRFNECDNQGVVFYANYLVYFDIAITELWRETVQPYAEMQAQGVDIMVGEVTIRYLDSARFDDEIDLIATVTHLGTSSMTTAMSIERVEDGKLLVEGELRHVFLDTRKGGTRPIPDAIRAALTSSA